MPIEADLVLSSFDSVPCRFCIVYKLKFCGHPMSSNSIGSHYFYSNICSHHVSESHFGNSWNISNFFIIIISVVVINDQGSLMLQLQKDYYSLKAQMVPSIFNKKVFMYVFLMEI